VCLGLRRTKRINKFGKRRGSAAQWKSMLGLGPAARAAEARAKKAVPKERQVCTVSVPVFLR
jgi:hypothetical protein